MSAPPRPPRPPATRLDLARRRVERQDWPSIGAAVDGRGFARLPDLLPRRDCLALRRLYDDDQRFRATIDMGPRRFGEGQYRYFADPIPPLVEAFRQALYPPLAGLAQEWARRLGGDPDDYPADLDAFLARCRAAGQERPTPLLLRYRAGDWNALHQDVYGDVAFPLQVLVLLSEPGTEFDGGEVVLVEQRPRAQSRAHAIALGQGDGLVFTNRDRPVRGARGEHRVRMRHGVSEVRSGERVVLGIIFHDAD